MVDPSQLPEHAPHVIQAALLWRVIGPPAGAFGKRLEQAVEDFRLQNFGRILQSAASKLGPSAGDDAAVPLRTVARVWDDGSYADAPVMAEYFGGILAASKADAGDNDRGASLASLIGSLSTDDVLLHFLIYDRMRRLFLRKGLESDELGRPTVRSDHRLFVPFAETDPHIQRGRLTAALLAVDRVGLVETMSWGDADTLDKRKAFEGDGFLVALSGIGAVLYLWAHGHPEGGYHEIADPDVSLVRADTDLPTLGESAQFYCDIPPKRSAPTPVE